MAKKKDQQDTTRSSKGKIAPTKISKKKEEEVEAVSEEEVEAASEESAAATPEESEEAAVEESSDEVSEEEIEEQATEKGSRKTGKLASSRGSKSAMPPAPAPKPSAPKSASFPMICMECHSEYDLSPGSGAETITCPACGHSCTMPDEDFFGKFSLYYNQQKKHILIGSILAILMVAFFIGWMYLLMHPAMAMKTSLMDEKLSPQNLNYAFGGALFLCVVLLMVEVVNYEKSIHHGYF